jgi:hypothetical protein
VATLALFIAPGLSACVANDPAITNYPRGGNLDLNDYGALLIDAGDPNCAQGAMYNLTTKLANHLNYPGSFQNWLDGYYVALIYGAALRLGDYLKLQSGAIVGNSHCSGEEIGPACVPNMYKLKGSYDYYFPYVIPGPWSGVYTSTIRRDTVQQRSLRLRPPRHGLDYTWYGFTEVRCGPNPTGPCLW